MKKLFVPVLAAVLSLFVLSAGAMAKENVVIDGISYEGNGAFEVDVKDTADTKAQIVWTEQETLSVKDSAGNEIPAVVVRYDEDTYKIFIQNAKKNDLYSFELKNAQLGDKKGIDLHGVLKTTHGWSLSGTHAQLQKLPQPAAAQGKQSLYIYEMEFNDGDEVEIEFRDLSSPYCNIAWDSNVKITATDASGKLHDVKIIGYDNDDIKIRISGVVKNEKYKIHIANIPVNGGRASFTADAVAVNGWKYRLLREAPVVTDASREHLNLYIKELEFERDNILDIEFGDVRNRRCDISWLKNEKFIVKDSNGRIYLTRPVEFDHDSAKIAIDGLEKGRSYTIITEDISYEGKNITLRAAFKARNNWEYKNRRREIK